ncbi:hypothetical protein LBMAG21_12810 [Armatimonadota bacterium]|nr:hypothetical protein [Armatimonadota bacterium]GDX40989.1 hypothetical protein LBMAG21_12810 [Armatimonadota bacterium]
MKVHVHVNHTQMKVDEVVQGKNADEIVSTTKSKVAEKAPFAIKLALRGMSNQMFMQELVKRYNSEAKPPKPLPIPASADEFLQIAAQMGVVTILEE